MHIATLALVNTKRVFFFILGAFWGVGGIIYRPRFFMRLKRKKTPPLPSGGRFTTIMKPNLKPVQKYNKFLTYANKIA